MPQLNRVTKSCLSTLLIVFMVNATSAVFAQEDEDNLDTGQPDERREERDTDRRNDRQERSDRGENNDRRSRWRIDDNDTSKNSDMLKRMLERYPDADENKDGVLDATEARAFIEKRREQWRSRSGRWNRDRLRPTYDDIPYGPHRDHVVDLYIAESEEPTPLVVYFHGGQFITGDESQLGTLQVKELLEAGISVASVDYRDTNLNPFPAPFEDAVRAIQFLRFYSEQLNVDPTRIAGHGEEAGGNLALYLAMHDDFAISPDEVKPLPTIGNIKEDAEDGEPAPLPSILPKKEDGEEEPPDGAIESLLNDGPQPWELPEIATASSRLACVVARHPIATFDPRSWKKHKLPMNDHERLMKKYLAVRYLDPVDDQDVIDLVEDVSPLALASADDPEVLLMSQYRDLKLEDNTVWTIMRHHPKQSQLIASALRTKGVKATVRYRDMPNDPGISSVEFFSKKLKK